MDHIWEPYSTEAVRIIAEWLNRIAGEVKYDRPLIGLFVGLTIIVIPVIGFALVTILSYPLAERLGVWSGVDFLGNPVGLKESIILGTATGLLAYFIIAIPLGMSFVPLLPRTVFRWAIFGLSLPALFIVSLIWEWVFRRLIPRLPKLNEYPLPASALASIVARYVLLVVALYALESWAKGAGYTYLTILAGIRGFLAAIGVLGSLIVEVAPITAYVSTRRITASALSTAIFLSLLASSAVPIMVFVNIPHLSII